MGHAPTFFTNHGGSQCFVLKLGAMHGTWHELEAYLHDFMVTLAEPPRAILAISGHWEEAATTVNAGAHLPLLFDYGGFPNYTHRLTWPAPGGPDVAARVRDLLSDAGIADGTENTRGGDHGILVPPKVMLPGADIPLPTSQSGGR